MVDVSNTSLVYLPTEDRKVRYFLLQDEWQFARDWQLTAGMRYDNYSDFGDTLNPRAALVWETRHDLTTKLMYGRAFRAPSFIELYNINNPGANGNPRLKPENMDSLELAFDYRPHRDVRVGLNFFKYWWKDLIQFVPDTGGTTITAQNAGAQTGHGGELEAQWKALDNLSLIGNFSYQNSTDENTDQDPGYSPHHQIYLRAEWAFLPDWQAVPQMKWVGERSRSAGDNRPPVSDYAWVDLTLRRTNVLDHMEIAFSVRNLLGVDAREPSPAGMPSAAIPYDLPLAGRSFFGEIRLNF
ncbi:MAG: TonB-dependent receptor [Methylomonas sp.]|nr:TonB-dependent receptor [Methylomonas sp.]